MSRPVRSRAVRALLRLLPRSVRVSSGSEMERLAAEMMRERTRAGARPGFGFWLRLAVDVVVLAVAEWVALGRQWLRRAASPTWEDHMSALWGDVRYGVRQLVRRPLYSGTIVLLMALGIAGNAAVFRVVNGLFLRPLPFESAERLVDLDETAPSWNLEFLNVAYRDFAAWRDGNRTFESMAVYSAGGGNFLGDGDAQRISYLLATHDIDEVLGIEPELGRFYGAEEDRPDGPRAMLLTQGFWEREYAKDPGVLGRTVSVDGYPVEIIGVLPAEARFFDDADVWMPLRQDETQWFGWGLNGIGRLAPSTTIEQARDDLTAIHRARIEQYEVNQISSPVVHSLRERHLGEYRLGSGFLLAAVGIVLLIACANIAGLMTARSFSRAHEMDVRLALGAPRARLVRQLLVESGVLAAFGAAAGVVLGVWGSGVLAAPLAEQLPTWVTFDLDARFVAFAVVVTAGAALLFGLVPALGAAGGGASASRVGRSTASASMRRGMNLLVAGEVALAVALLVVGGLTVLDARRLGDADPGFEPVGLMVFQLGLPAQRYPDDGARLAFAEGYLERLSAIPGVQGAAVANVFPLSGHFGFFLIADGAPPRGEDEANPVVLNRVVSPSYFETVGVRLVRGRFFDERDGRIDTPPVAIVNETFVRTHLSHLADPVGARIFPSTDPPGDDAEWWTVVGVTEDVKHYGLDEPMRPGLYQPMTQVPLGSFHVALRTRSDPSAIVAAVRTVTASVDVELPIYRVRSMTDAIDTSLWTRRATSWVIGAFSAIALLMAVAGIYGVISYTVGQRSREIGVRLAMGADKARVLRDVVGEGMALVGVGAVIGLGLSAAAARLVAGILVEVSATTPAVYAAVTAVVLSVAALANYVPARRASALDPVEVLRGE